MSLLPLPCYPNRLWLTTRSSRVAAAKISTARSAHYTGWMTNGEMFDSSILRGEPSRPHWTE